MDVALGEPHDGIRVRQTGKDRQVASAMAREDEHFDRTVLKQVEMALIRLMRDHIPWPDHMSPGIACLDVPPAQHDREEWLDMLMPRERFAAGMAGPGGARMVTAPTTFGAGR